MSIGIRRVTVAVTGASGSIYAERLIQFLIDHVDRIYLLASDAGAAVADHELTMAESEQFCLRRVLKGDLNEREKKIIRLFKKDDLFAPIASGSSVADAMVVIPASMGSVARIACGLSSNLIERAADVAIKQKKKLIVVPRESPLSVIHLRNMLTLAEAGVYVVPAMPGFYQKPKSLDDAIDFVVGRVLEAMDIDHNLYKKWNSRLL